MATNEKNPGSRSRSGQTAVKGRSASRPAQKRTAPASKANPAAPVKKRPAQKRTQSTRQAVKPQPKREASVGETPPVVYTPPIPFSRHRFLLRLLTVAAVVIALLFGLSIFFKVDGDRITVSGTEKYTAYEIRQASGIQDGENLLTISSARVSARIRAALPYVKSVRVGITLPDTVHIDIVEEELLYAVKGEEGAWWLINGQGRILEQTDAATAEENTRIMGVYLAAPKAGQQAIAWEEPAATPDPSDPSAEATPITVTGQMRFQAAMSVIAQLEANGVLGSVATVHVDNPGDMELWYGQQYQVKLGDSSRLDYKISAMKAAISQMSDYQTGILDVSKAASGEGVIFSQFKN